MCDENSNNCNSCSTVLKEHLTKCAAMGQRPASFQCCDGPSSKSQDACKANSLAGPPSCTGNSGAPKCGPPAQKPLVVFKPSCNVPATATFKCPDGECCDPPPKPKSASAAPSCPSPSKNEEASSCSAPAPKCPTVVTSDGKPLGEGKCPKRGSTCGK